MPTATMLASILARHGYGRGRASTWRTLLPWTVLALGLRLVVLDLVPSTPSWDGTIYTRAAEQLAAGEGYTQRILGDDQATTPTAFYPPGFPALLAVVRTLGGGLAADRILQALISAALVPLAFLLARRAFGARAARYAAAVATLWPGAVLLSASWLAEPTFALMCALALVPLAYARRARRTRALVLAALLLGLAAYVRPTALVLAALLGALAGARSARSRTRKLPVALITSVATVLVACAPLLPWALRNHHTLGAPVLVSTNGGYNLWLGALGEGGYQSATEPAACDSPLLHELARDRCFRDHALELVARDPLAFAGRSLLKLAHTFGHESAPAQVLIAGLPSSDAEHDALATWLLGLCRIGWLAIAPFVALGAITCLRRGPRAGREARRLLLLPVLAIAALHAVFIAGDRYHAAAIPMLAALAGCGLARFLAAHPAHEDAHARSTREHRVGA